MGPEEYVDPRLIHHKAGPGSVVDQEKSEIRNGVEMFIRDAASDSGAVKSLVLELIADQKARVDRGETRPWRMRSCLEPVELAFDLNEIGFPWKNMTRLVGDSERSNSETTSSRRSAS